MEIWRLIQDPALTGAGNMAVDEAILRALDSGDSRLPVLRLYGWAHPTISLGYLQDASRLKDSGIPLVRRITGGRAVLHDIELTYAVFTNSGHRLFSEGILGAYSIISSSIIDTLKGFGIDAAFSKGSAGEGRDRDACFHTPSRYEVLANGKKLVGSAQRRFKNSFLQHGSILFDIDTELNGKVFGRPVLERMTCLSSLKAIGMEDFKAALIDRFSKGMGASFEEGGLTDTEKYLRDRLFERKYSTAEWNLSGKSPAEAGNVI